MTRIYIIDTETNNKNKDVGNFTANPHYRGNEIVYGGIKQLGAPDVTALMATDTFTSLLYGGDVLVGQNIKFDLLYLMRDDKFREETLPNLRIWDTMVVEYLLTGQQSKFASLDQLSLKYGGTIKDKRLEELWNSGVDTEDIDEEIVIPYLKNDVTNTELTFKHQLAEVQRRNIMPFIRTQMDAMLATVEMEYNGMYFNKADALFNAKLIRARCDDMMESCIDFMRTRLNNPKPNIDSVDQVSLTLFGGEEKYTADKIMMNEFGNPIIYKSGAKKGQYRTKRYTLTKTIHNCVQMRHAKPRKKDGFYTVSDEVLKNIQSDPSTNRIPKAFVTDLMEYRKLSKDLKTYYEGYSDLVWPHDSCIHGTYNHCQTATGRLSHSSPNLGNVSHKDIE